MALIKPIHGEMSGSIGGNTYAHNKGGQYVRQRTIPTQPNSQRQVAIRSYMSMAIDAWLNVLDANGRALW